MAFCPNCGKQIEGGQSFCANCGAALQPVGQYPPPSYERDVRENKAFAIISYIGFLSIVSYFAAPNSPYARYHAVQGLNLFILEVILSVAGNILRAILGWWIFGGLISAVIGLCGIAFLVFSILGIVNASQGKMEELPVIGSIKFVKN